MRILWLKSDLLLPLDKGGKLRTWHLMRHLARATRSPISRSRSRASRRPTSRACARSRRASRRSRARSRPKGTLRSTPTRRCTSSIRCPTPSASTARARSGSGSTRCSTTQAFDLIVCDFLFPAVNLPKRLPCPAVIFTHNVESEIWRRHAETQDRRHRHGCSTARSTGGCCATRRRTLARFDGVLAVSDADRETFARALPRRHPPAGPRRPDRRRHRLLRAGADPQSAIRNPQSIFTGSMDWLPNEDAMLYFCRDILPLIRAEEPDVTPVDRRPRADARGRSGSPTSTASHVTGRVDDVRPYMRDAAVYIVPLRIGGGTRLKIFEAMAMGKAVVSTTVGAEGLPVTDGEHVHARRRAARVRARRRPPAARRRAPRRGSRRPPARSSSSATTGRRSPARSKTRSERSPSTGAGRAHRSHPLVHQPVAICKLTGQLS